MKLNKIFSVERNNGIDNLKGSKLFIFDFKDNTYTRCLFVYCVFRFFFEECGFRGIKFVRVV